MAQIDQLTSINQNYRCGDRADPVDKTKWAERSCALGGKEWGEVNSEVGGRTSNYEEFAFGLGIIKNYFNSFFDLEENPFVGFIVRALTGASDFLEGKRDQEMYGKVYGHGVDKFADRSIEELKD